MTLRNAGLLRKLPEDDNLYLTIDGTRFTLNGGKIPRLLSGYSQPISPNGMIRVRPRKNHDDVIDIDSLGLTYTIKRATFEAVWSGKMPTCTIWERVPDCWQGFNCPFCRSADLDIKRRTIDEDKLFRIICSECGAMSGGVLDIICRN